MTSGTEGLRVVAQVSPTEASCVVASVGTLKEVEDRVLTPSIRAITRDVAGGSFDNRNIYTQLDYLATAWAITGDARYRDGSLRGLQFTLAQQIGPCAPNQCQRADGD